MRFHPIVPAAGLTHRVPVFRSSECAAYPSKGLVIEDPAQVLSVLLPRVRWKKYLDPPSIDLTGATQCCERRKQVHKDQPGAGLCRQLKIFSGSLICSFFSLAFASLTPVVKAALTDIRNSATSYDAEQCVEGNVHKRIIGLPL